MAPAQLRKYYDIGKDNKDSKERNWVGGWYLRRSIYNAPKKSMETDSEVLLRP
jgi:hypothetical protein